MKGPNPPKNSADLFLRIAKLSAAAEWTTDELHDALRDGGVDPERFAADILDRIKSALRESPAYWRNMASQRREALMAKVQAAWSHVQWHLGREAVIEKIKEISARLPSALGEQYGVAFRGFNECSDEDLASMLEELEIIERLTQREPGD